MRIFELTREAVAQPKPLPILPQGAQTPPPPLTDKDVALNKSPMSGKNPQLQVPATAAPATAPAATKPAAAPATAPAAAKPAPVAAAPKNMSGMPGYDEAGKPLNAVGSAPKTIAPYGVVNPLPKSGVVSKADLEDYRVKSGNPTATLGQYMNQQQGLTARKGGANDPAVIAARQQPVGPPVGSQAQTAGGKNELAKQNIAGLAASQVAQSPAAQPPLNVVSRNDGVPPPEPAAAVPGQRPGGIAFNQDAGATAAPAVPGQRPGGIAFNQDAGATAAPAADPTAAANPMTGFKNSGGNKGGAGPSYAGQGGNQTTAAAQPAADPTAAANPMTGFKNSGGNGSGAGPSWGGQGGDQTTTAAAPAAAPNPNSGSGYTGGAGNVADFGVRGTPILPYGQGSPVGGTTNAVTRTDAEIGDTNLRTGVVTPGSFDKNRAQGEKNLNALKGLFGGNKQPTAPAAAPAQTSPLRGVKESARVQDPVLVRMQNLAGIRR